MPVRASYADADFRRAMGLVGGALPPSLLAEAVGVGWDRLTRIGVGAAAEALGPRARDASAVTSGAEAFAAGFLIGTQLAGGAADAGRGGHLRQAMELVRERGPHTVIAERCDLRSVLRLEEAHATAIAETLEEPGTDMQALRTPLAILLEWGLAAGLVLVELSAPAQRSSM